MPYFCGSTSVAQIETLHQFLAERTAHTLGEQGVFGMQLHAGRVIAGVLAIAAHAHIAGGHALDAAILVIEHFRGGEAGIDLDAQSLGLAGQPTADIAQRDDIHAVIGQERRHEELRHFGMAGLAQRQEMIAFHRRVERGALFFPIGDQLVQGFRIHHRARQDMGADFRAFLDHADRKLLAGFGSKLTYTNRGRQAGRAAAHDDDIKLHRFAFHRTPRFHSFRQFPCICFYSIVSFTG